MKEEILEIIPPICPELYYKYVIKPDLDYINSCCGISEKLLGKNESN